MNQGELEAGRNQEQLSALDLAGILLGVLLIATLTCVLSSGRIFWEDEMLGWMLLHDVSWSHMIQAWKAGADGGGFSFYLLGRVWFYLFGSSELAFRLFSATAFALAFAVTWVAARRFYSVAIVAFALFNTFFFSRTFLLHMREGRFYGLLVLSVALVFWLSLVLQDQPASPPAKWYGLIFLAHALLTSSHLLGIVFSAFFLASTALLDHLEGCWRPGLYGAGVAAWMVLLPERANIIASARVGKPHFWIQRPHLADVIGVYTGVSQEIGLVFLLLLALAGWSVWKSRSGLHATLQQAWMERKPVYVTAGALLLVPVAFLLEGTMGPWLFHERYLLPCLLAMVYVTAELLQLVSSKRPLGIIHVGPVTLRSIWLVGLSGYAALLLFWVFHHVVDFTPSQKDYTDLLTKHLPPGTPVVCEDAFSFTELVGRQRGASVPYMFLLDWDQSVSPSAPLLEVTQYHLMKTWKQVGYFSKSIEDLAPFLQQNDMFFVLHAAPIRASKADPIIGNPLIERFERNPNYETRKYLQLDRKTIRDTVWMVCRHRCAAEPRPVINLVAPG